MAGGVGLSAVLFIFLPKFLAVLVALPVAIFSAALAFYKVNGKPFVNVVEAFVTYSLTSKLYIWKKEEKAAVGKPQETPKPIEQIRVPKLSGSKLKELTWSLDIKENQNPVTEDSTRV